MSQQSSVLPRKARLDVGQTFLLPTHIYLFGSELGPIHLIFHPTNMVVTQTGDITGLSAGPFAIQTANGHLIQEILAVMPKNV